MTTAAKYVLFALISCNMIMSMEQSSTYDTEYYMGHKLEWSTEHSDGITHIAYSPLKEQPFFVVGSEDNSITLLHQNGSLGFQAATEYPITSLTVRPDAQEIAVGTSGEQPSVILYDINTGTRTSYMQFAHDEQNHSITDISYSPSGDHCAAVMQNGTVYVWNQEDTDCMTKISSKYKACSARILSDNIVRIITRDGKVYTFPMTQPHLLEKFNMQKNIPVAQIVSRPLLSQDGQECIASFLPRTVSKPEEITVYIFDLLHKSFVNIPEGRGISHAAFSQDRSVCAAIFGRMLTTYHRISEPGIDGFNHVVTHSSTPSTSATALACSPDGSHMVTSLRPQTIALWRLIKECRTVKNK